MRYALLLIPLVMVTLIGCTLPVQRTAVIIAVPGDRTPAVQVAYLNTVALNDRK
jgi:hypothetical protein